MRIGMIGILFLLYLGLAILLIISKKRKMKRLFIFSLVGLILALLVTIYTIVVYA